MFPPVTCVKRIHNTTSKTATNPLNDQTDLYVYRVITQHISWKRKIQLMIHFLTYLQTIHVLLFFFFSFE